jgi:RNA-directed DNA polymerase
VIRNGHAGFWRGALEKDPQGTSPAPYLSGQVQPPEQAEVLDRSPVFRPVHKATQDRWVFGDRRSGAYMHKFSWTRILRHRIVKHRASPDDPKLADYWAWRRRKVPLPVNKTTQGLVDAPGRSLCDLWRRPVPRRGPAAEPARVGTVAGHRPPDINTISTREPSTWEKAEPCLVHADCRKGNGLALHNAYEPSGLA